MPSFVSHNIFAKELAQSLNDDAKNIIQEYKSILNSMNEGPSN